MRPHLDDSWAVCQLKLDIWNISTMLRSTPLMDIDLLKLSDEILNIHNRRQTLMAEQEAK